MDVTLNVHRFVEGDYTKEALSNLRPGDLVFFGRWKENGDPAVGHVGFYLGGGRFIHSLGMVKIGSFNPEDPCYDAFNTGRYLFGTDNHLSTEGVAIRTERTIRDLKNELEKEGQP